MDQEFAQGGPTPLEPNPVRTGADIREVAQFVLGAAEGWQDRNRNWALLLKALARLASENPERANSGFEPSEIIEVVQRISEQNRAAGIAEPAKWVARYWKELEKHWESKREGLRQLAEDRRVSWIPVIHKEESTGGTGLHSRYFLRYAALSPSGEGLVSGGPKPRADGDAIGRRNTECEMG